LGTTLKISSKATREVLYAPAPGLSAISSAASSGVMDTPGCRPCSVSRTSAFVVSAIGEMENCALALER
tara:strand:+ start:324 stop:530 length:207 start_codon:yes stop_codon:yes gene_type:complete